MSLTSTSGLCPTLLLLACVPAAAAEYHIDASSVVGTIRPLHGVNNGPLNLGETVDLTEHYRELGIPLARLHDAEWPGGDLIDIHAIFPNPTADPNSPASYRFAKTDAYVQAVVDSGVGIVYRLGESIEHSRVKHHVHPPADPGRWAEVCLGIIRHYNDGWADGFRHGIRYWEVWNEPENRPAMWTGTDEDYFRLYEAVAMRIKAAYPDLKVGGPSVGAVGEVVEGRFEPSRFTLDFLARCRDRKLPLDFFSWHTYADDPSVYAAKARAIRQLLDEHGFAATENHLNEWNYLPDNDWSPVVGTAKQGAPRRRFYERQGRAEGAAFVACVLASLQESPVDVTNFYSGDTNQFGLFDRDGTPKKTFFAFKAFRTLLDTPHRLRVSGGEAGRTVVCAGVNEDRTRVVVLVANYRSEDPEVRLRIDGLSWRGLTRYEVLRVDAARDLERVKTETLPAGDIELEERLPAPGVLVLRLEAARGE